MAMLPCPVLCKTWVPDAPEYPKANEPMPEESMVAVFGPPCVAAPPANEPWPDEVILDVPVTDPMATLLFVGLAKTLPAGPRARDPAKVEVAVDVALMKPKDGEVDATVTPPKLPSQPVPRKLKDGDEVADMTPFVACRKPFKDEASVVVPNIESVPVAVRFPPRNALPDISNAFDSVLVPMPTAPAKVEVAVVDAVVIEPNDPLPKARRFDPTFNPPITERLLPKYDGPSAYIDPPEIVPAFILDVSRPFNLTTVKLLEEYVAT